jgi:hypothetical protein
MLVICNEVVGCRIGTLRHLSGRQNHNVKITNEYFKKRCRFKYLEKSVANQNYINEEIESILNLGIVCYQSAQNHLYFRFLRKNTKINIDEDIILLVVLYECETWSLTLKEERRLRMFENRVVRRIFRHKRKG